MSNLVTNQLFNSQNVSLFDKNYWINQDHNFVPGNDLQDLQELNKYRSLRIPKNISKYLVAHKDYISLIYFLSLKPLFKSSVIFNQDQKIPYNKLANFLNISHSGLRFHLTRLKDLKLIRVSKNKNITLASYKTFCNLFNVGTHTYKHKYYFQNNTDLKTFIKSIVYAENLKKQDYTILKKLCYICSKLELSDFVNGKSAELDDILLQYNIDCELEYMQGIDKYQEPKYIKHHKKFILKHFDYLKERYQERYEKDIEQKYHIINDRYYERNLFDPQTTLSCTGFARILNRKSKSTGLYQERKMFESGYVYIFNRYLFTDSFSTLWERKEQLRQDVNFRVTKKNRLKDRKYKDQNIDKYSITLANEVNLSFNLENC